MNIYKIPGFKKSIAKNTILFEIFTKLKLDNIKFYIAGGSILSSVQKTFNITSHYNDIDVYFETEEDFKRAELILLNEIILEEERAKKAKEEKKAKNLFNDFDDFDDYDADDLDDFDDYNEFRKIIKEYETKNAILYDTSGVKLQFIKMNYGIPEQIVDKFDLENSKYWSLFPFNEAFTLQPIDTLYKISTNYINNFWVVNRIKKYVCEKSLDADAYAEQLFDIMLTNNIDYTTFNSDYLIHGNPAKYDRKFFSNCLYFDEFINVINIKYKNNIEYDWIDLLEKRPDIYIDVVRLDKLTNVLPSYIVRSQNNQPLTPIYDRLKEDYPEYLL